MASNGRTYDSSHNSDCELIIEILPDEDSADYAQSSDHIHRPADHNGDESIYMQECSRVANFHVNSTLLGEKSSFFDQLFANATTMDESLQRSAVLNIQACEESAFLELLNYMHSGTLTSTAASPALLKLADKFQVVSCVRLCASLLIEIPMTTQSASLILDLTSNPNITAVDEVQRLVDAATQFMAPRFFELDCHEMRNMSVACMEAILSSDSLVVGSEDLLFGTVGLWLEDRYPKPEDQRKVFSTRVGRYIRFPFLSRWMLEKRILGSDVLDEDFMHKVVMDALLFKCTKPFDRYHDQTVVDRISATHHGYVRRAYERAPVRVLEFESPCQEVVVYLDIHTPLPFMISQTFWLGECLFLLYVQGADCLLGPSRFVIQLENESESDEPLALEYEFAVRSKCTKRFVTKSGGPIELGPTLVLYEAPLLDFEEGKSLDFIDGVVYVELKLRRRIESINRALK